MCRFLVLRGEQAFTPTPIWEAIRERCETSPEYQGHGWGACWRINGEWARYRSLTPIWEDRPELPERVDFFVVHARSAFRDEGIELDNNMPFYRGDRIFVFNGELRGVRMRVPGRIGAEKVFHLIEQQDPDLEASIAKTDRLLTAKSERIRAMNLAVTDGDAIHAICRYSESPEYFTLYFRTGDIAGVCSEALDSSYSPMANGEQRVL